VDDVRTDAQLIARAADEPELFGDVFDRHFATIHRYLERRAGADAADDLAPEVFRVAFEQRRGFEPLHDSALPWLYGVATKLMLKRWRSERRGLHALALLRAPAGHVEPGLDAVNRKLDAVATRSRLLRALAALPKGERDVVVLVAWEDLSYDEVATALEIPVGTVRSRLSRARRKLRELVGDAGNEPLIMTCEPQGDLR
jgi:RNA polymerase sigma-70 factor (ECF subfamily)